MSKMKLTTEGDRHVVVTRRFNASPEQVYRAHTEPKLIQNIDGKGIQLRTFAIDPSGRLLVAASIMPLPTREGNSIGTLSAGISVMRIGADGKLSFVRKYDVDTAKGQQFWSGMVTLA